MYHVEEIVEPIAIKSSGISKSEFVNLLILYLHLSKDIWRFTYRYLREQVVNLLLKSLVLSGEVCHLIGQSVDRLHQACLGLHILLVRIPQLLHHILQFLVLLGPFILAFNKEVYH